MSDMADRSHFLVSAGWLAARLHDPKLRIFDCSVRLVPDPKLHYTVGGAFALALIGGDQVSVYDGSLNEWGGDPSLPMRTGPD